MNMVKNDVEDNSEDENEEGRKMMLNMKVEEMVLKIVYISVFMRLVSRTPGHVKLD